MPSIRPKNAGEWALLGLTGTKGLNARMDVVEHEARVAGSRGGQILAQRESQRRDAQAAMERQAYDLEIERVKRKQAEEDAAKARTEQERTAQREATRWGIERVQRDIAAQSQGGQLDPKTRESMERAGQIADQLSPAAQAVFLDDVRGLAAEQRMAQARDQASDALANTIKDLGTSEIDATPFIAELQNAQALIASAETPQQLAQAVGMVRTTTAQARAAVIKAHVEVDTRNAAVASINELLGADPAKSGLASSLSRAVQFGALEPKQALDMAVKERYGLKPPTAQEIAAKGGDPRTLYSDPRTRQAYAWMVGEARGRALKELGTVVGSQASPDERGVALETLLERHTQLVLAENGWYSPIQQQQQQPAPGVGGPPEQQPEQPALYPLSKRPGAEVKGPAVPLEKVREAMGAPQAAPAPKDDPKQTKAALAAEMVKRAKERGWTKEQAKAEYEKALSEMGLGGQ